MTDQATNEAQDGGPRQRAIEAYEGARDRASDTLSQAPLIALAGGLAAGALIAALLPRTDAENRLVRPTARRVKKTAGAALDAARDTGSQRLDEMGLNRQKGEDTIRKLLDDLTDAAKASADAALEAARNANES
jgi:glutamine synthetase adenylyltransferase